MRILFLGLIGGWLMFPIVQIGGLAEDAIPFVSAARVDASEPHTLYGGDGPETTPQIRDVGCQLKPAGTDCHAFGFPFLGPPQVIPVMKAINLLGDEGSLVGMRFIAAFGMAAGMFTLWNRVATHNRDAQVALFATAVLLTPYTYISSAFGQNSPLMFLSACLGLSRTEWGKRPLRGIREGTVFVLSAIFKIFPLPLAGIALVRRRWRFLAWSIVLFVVLTATTAAMVPAFQYGEFWTTSRNITSSRVASPWNISVDSLIQHVNPSWRGQGAAFYGLLLARLGAIGGLFWWRLREADDDVQWSYAWVAILAVHPQIWWHYFAVIIPASAYLLRGRTGPVWRVMIAAAVSLVPLALVTDETTLKIYAPILILTATIALPFLAASRDPGDEPGRAEVVGA